MPRPIGMFLPLFYIISLPWSLASPLSLSSSSPRAPGLHLPLSRREVNTSTPQRVRKRVAIGLGDYFDVTYNVLVQVGETVVPLVIDTGSSDLWVLSSPCSIDCFAPDVPLYPLTSFQPSGLDVHLKYGDSLTGTFAQGSVGMDVVGIAGLRLQDQYLAAISETNTNVVQSGSAGVFGLGFPVNSMIWNELLASMVTRETSVEVPNFSSFRPRVSSDLSDIHGHPSPAILSHLDQSPFPNVDDILASFASNGPLLARLILTGALASPIVAISLQRDTVDIGGNQGMVSIGELPIGVAMEDLSWVPLRGYTTAEGGLPAPEESPNEVYPITWEVAIDDVYFDGQRLSRSSLTASNVTLTALLDTGNALIRGPRDVLDAIISQLGGDAYDCAEAHTLTFQIGGRFYPVDPRDFGAQTFEDTTSRCTPNIAPTDPSSSGFLYSWSIGDPFFKSTIVAFYYGNLTHPSQDHPRVGLLSTVPPDAAQRLQAAVLFPNATFGDSLPSASEPALSSAPPPTRTNTTGVPHFNPQSQISRSTDAAPNHSRLSLICILGLLTIIFVM